MESIKQPSNQNNIFLQTIEANLINDYEHELSQQQVNTICDIFNEVSKSSSPFDQGQTLDKIKLSIKDKSIFSAIDWLTEERLGKYDANNPIKIPTAPVDENQEKEKKIHIFNQKMFTPMDQLNTSRQYCQGVLYSNISYEKEVEIGKFLLSLEGKRLKTRRKIGKNPSTNSIWLAEKTKEDRYVWRSEKQVDKHDLQKLIQFIIKLRPHSQISSIHINSGSHGDESGKGANQGNTKLIDRNITIESKCCLIESLEIERSIDFFSEKDINTLNNKFSIHSIAKYLPNVYPECADHIIDPQCKGAHGMVYKGYGLNEDLMFLDKGQLPKNVYPQEAFGAKKWESYFGDVGQVPSLPNNIEDILNSKCPYTGKKVRESHLLTLIPATVNGQALTLSKLGELIRSPKKGSSTYSNFNVGENDKAVNSSYWTLLLKDVIPNSRKKTFDEQKQLLKQNYNVPKAIETAVSVLMHHVQGGEKLYSDSPDTYTRSEEKYNGYRLLVGGFGSGGLNVYNRFNLIVDYGNEYSGVSALRKF
jgi:hypothetical protein